MRLLALLPPHWWAERWRETVVLDMIRMYAWVWLPQINLFLRVVRRREDGYHDLASLFHVSQQRLLGHVPVALTWVGGVSAGHAATRWWAACRGEARHRGTATLSGLPQLGIHP